mgnify:CR=1 FL=1
MLNRTLCRATLFDDLSNSNKPQADNCAQIRRTSVNVYCFLSKINNVDENNIWLERTKSIVDASNCCHFTSFTIG